MKTSFFPSLTPKCIWIMETALGFRESISKENIIYDQVAGTCLLAAGLCLTFLVWFTRTDSVIRAATGTQNAH